MGAEHLQRLGAVGAYLHHQPQPAADHLFGEDLGLGAEGAQPQHHGDVTDVPSLAQHHDADDYFDLVVGLVDVARRLAGLFEVLLRDLSGGVGVDHENLGLLEAELFGFPQVLAEGVGVDVLLGHDEEHRLRLSFL